MIVDVRGAFPAEEHGVDGDEPSAAVAVSDLVGFSELGLRGSHQIMSRPMIWWDPGCGSARWSWD
ncbi:MULTISPECIES: hypothetical protein [Pseudofrankia]|uniref:hypothetical protein n=1 Tax=Pseudofrankia TaxID=2994363 RepID=UPI00048800BA|nr:MULTISPECIES: hypothetical protein [Pseudofrankia]